MNGYFVFRISEILKKTSSDLCEKLWYELFARDKIVS